MQSSHSQSSISELHRKAYSKEKYLFPSVVCIALDKYVTAVMRHLACRTYGDADNFALDPTSAKRKISWSSFWRLPLQTFPISKFWSLWEVRLSMLLRILSNFAFSSATAKRRWFKKIYERTKIFMCWKRCMRFRKYQSAWNYLIWSRGTVLFAEKTVSTELFHPFDQTVFLF